MIQPNIGPEWFWRIIFMIVGVTFIGFMYGLYELTKLVLLWIK